jgi:hypothetical protein
MPTVIYRALDGAAETILRRCRRRLLLPSWMNMYATYIPGIASVTISIPWLRGLDATSAR